MRSRLFLDSSVISRRLPVVVVELGCWTKVSRSPLLGLLAQELDLLVERKADLTARDWLGRKASQLLRGHADCVPVKTLLGVGKTEAKVCCCVLLSAC